MNRVGFRLPGDMGEEESIPGYHAAIADDRYGSITPLRQRPLGLDITNDWEESTRQYRRSSSSSAEEWEKSVRVAGNKPLVDHCTNEWKKSQQYLAKGGLPFYSEEEDDYLDRFDEVLDKILAVLHSHRFRQVLLGLGLTVVFLLFLLLRLPGSAVEENWRLAEALDMSMTPGRFGSNLTPEFPDMVYIETLKPDLLPGDMGSPDPKPKNGRRLIFVGDIHGCKEELQALLQKVSFNKSKDHLITTGDVINKGPDSAGVVDVLRELGASSVRGNHDDRIILEADSMSSSKMRKLGSQDTSNTMGTISREKQLAQSLTNEQLEYLQSSPLILHVGHIKSMGEVVVTHAGLVPGLPLEKQDPSSVMTMRIMDLATFVPSKDHERQGSVPWMDLWNKHQTMLPQTKKWFFWDADRENHTTVIYGHDSKKGLQIREYTKGLDSGCYKGGQLTALVVGDGGSQQIVQVDGKDYRPGSEKAA